MISSFIKTHYYIVAVMINHHRWHQESDSHLFDPGIKMIRLRNVAKDDCLHDEHGNKSLNNDFSRRILRLVMASVPDLPI